MYQCSFCKAQSPTTRIPNEWGRAKLQAPGLTSVDVTFCPLHKEEAMEKLDLAFEQIKGQ
ncbi:hypothetical protein LCGC14_1766410 [marine sediment metagenome]|uniref:Uncharacterized protein n=1 Tax=marine sediment metagenome TaxID=412755 RepID=A0A0F9GZH8_9ZZZZ